MFQKFDENEQEKTLRKIILEKLKEFSNIVPEDDEQSKEKIVNLLLDKELFDREEVVNIIGSNKDFEDIVQEAMESENN